MIPVVAIQAVAKPKFMDKPSHAWGQYVILFKRGYTAKLTVVKLSLPKKDQDIQGKELKKRHVQTTACKSNPNATTRAYAGPLRV